MENDRLSNTQRKTIPGIKKKGGGSMMTLFYR